MTLNKEIFESAQKLNTAFADEIALRLGESIAQTGEATLFVSGGRTPAALFDALSKKDISWDNVTISLVDDRWVDENADASNAKLVREKLLQNNAASAVFMSLKTDHSSAFDAQPQVEKRLAALPRPFTVVILGMGEDGHTASLFPCSEQVEQGTDINNPAISIATQPTTAPHERMSLTLREIAQSKHVYLHLVGDKKKAVLEQAMDESAPVKPIVSVIKHTDVTLYWAP